MSHEHFVGFNKIDVDMRKVEQKFVQVLAKNKADNYIKDKPK